MTLQLSLQKKNSFLVEVYEGEDITLTQISYFRNFFPFVGVPDAFFDEIEKYAKRNVIYHKDSYRDQPKESVCLRCFKAYLIIQIDSFSLPTDLANYILGCFPHKAGHNGYYLDRKEK